MTSVSILQRQTPLTRSSRLARPAQHAARCRNHRDARSREESRGAHQREDYPVRGPSGRSIKSFVSNAARPGERVPAREARCARRDVIVDPSLIEGTLRIWRGAAAKGPFRNPRSAVRTRAIGPRRPALAARECRSLACHSFLVHQRQCLQGMRDAARRQNGLRRRGSKHAKWPWNR